mgnify:CR=1 FL=1
MPRRTHSHYSTGQDDDGYYINHYTFNDGESFARRETIYSNIPTEGEAANIEGMLLSIADYLVL